MRGPVAFALALLTAAVVAAPTSAVRIPPIPAQTLNQQHATLQFQGTMTTHWLLGPYSSDDGCELDMRHGTGSQRVQYSTTHNGHANRALVTIVDSGNNLTFQPKERARPGRPAAGFRTGQIDQTGIVADEYTNSPQRDPVGCPPLTADKTQDQSGCGTEHVPWDVNVTAVGSRFQVFVAAFPSNGLVAHCPLYTAPEVGSGGGVGSFPQHTFETIPLSRVRSAMEKPHGKLVVHGSQRWESSEPIGQIPVTTTTIVTWKVTLIRAHP